MLIIDSPTLLFLDNHSSHLSVEAIDFAIANRVTIISFPPLCCHELQPLDVSVYGPAKAYYYRSQCNTWGKNNVAKVIEIRHIPGLVRLTLDLALTPHNIKSGFEKTGIFPFNPDKFTEFDFVQTALSHENVSAAALEVGRLQPTRTPKKNPTVDGKLRKARY